MPYFRNIGLEIAIFPDFLSCTFTGYVDTDGRVDGTQKPSGKLCDQFFHKGVECVMFMVLFASYVFSYCTAC